VGLDGAAPARSHPANLRPAASQWPRCAAVGVRKTVPALVRTPSARRRSHLGPVPGWQHARASGPGVVAQSGQTFAGEPGPPFTDSVHADPDLSGGGCVRGAPVDGQDDLRALSIAVRGPRAARPSGQEHPLQISQDDDKTTRHRHRVFVTRRAAGDLARHAVLSAAVKDADAVMFCRR
jgi:hypothetical protein